MLRRFKDFLIGVGLWTLANIFESSQRRQEMNRDARKASHLYLLVASLIIIASLLTCCTRYTSIVSVDLGPYFSGRAVCDQKNHTIIVYNSNLEYSPYKKYTLLHEAVHVEQARRLKGGCNELSRRYLADASFRLGIEGEAYCAVAKQMYVDHTGTHNDWLWLVFAMSKYGTEDQIPCKEHPP